MCADYKDMGYRNFRGTGEDGGIVVIVGFALVVMLGFAAFAIDFGLLFTNWRTIQFAVDSAAINGVQAIADGATDSGVRDSVLEVAEENSLLGGSEIVAASDVEIGNWNETTGVFLAGVTPRNAVRVAARRQVATAFAGVVGVDSLNPVVQSIAVVSQTLKPKCVTPFGIEAGNFPEDLNIGEVPLDMVFDGEPYRVTLGSDSEQVETGNWGKIDVPDADGNPINSSGNDFCWAMLPEEMHEDICNGLPPEDFTSCAPPLAIGDGLQGIQYEPGTGSSDVSEILAALIGQEIVMLVSGDFPQGNSGLVDVFGYALGTITDVRTQSGNKKGGGKNIEIDLEITRLQTTPPLDPNGSGPILRYLVH